MRNYYFIFDNFLNSYPLKLICNNFRYDKFSKTLIENVIKTGTFFRTMLPVFIPLSIYQYIRQVDRDRYAEEIFYEYSKSENLKSFYDSSTKYKNIKNWRIQHDLYLIDQAVNS
ncbi:hypothetical protein YYG_02975 [Plasmodium vinckei petteri]|uniref:Uncharacterized protein n=2 Tax=Plasmodium vinckei TaxID=5860 RepID=W7AE12_PLAVN|nr:hypothetical protein YYG_02975 [Plasmodium vinckei petteri]CAD2099117.1 conserved Plasmodium protein, unknown function [Plasmodium vinckei petteri]CAD2101437.1 conserved Plasmodium protein, unknown function [Plasmodium vinckei lentum]